MTRYEFAATLVAAIEDGREDDQVAAVYAIEDAYPGELPEMTEDDTADIAAIWAWGKGE